MGAVLISVSWKKFSGSDFHSFFFCLGFILQKKKWHIKHNSNKKQRKEFFFLTLISSGRSGKYVSIRIRASSLIWLSLKKFCIICWHCNSACWSNSSCPSTEMAPFFWLLLFLKYQQKKKAKIITRYIKKNDVPTKNKIKFCQKI